MFVPITAAAAVACLRERRGLSQRAASTAAGLAPSYVAKLERSQLEPSLAAFAALAVSLEMNHHEAWLVLQTEAQVLLERAS